MIVIKQTLEKIEAATSEYVFPYKTCISNTI